MASLATKATWRITKMTTGETDEAVAWHKLLASAEHSIRASEEYADHIHCLYRR